MLVAEISPVYDRNIATAITLCGLGYRLNIVLQRDLQWKGADHRYMALMQYVPTYNKSRDAGFRIISRSLHNSVMLWVQVS